jgi:hypothetical protein
VYTLHCYVLQTEEEKCVNVRRDSTFLNGSCDGTLQFVILNFRTSSISDRMDQLLVARPNGFHLGTEIVSISKTLCFVCNTKTMDKINSPSNTKRMHYS